MNQLTFMDNAFMTSLCGYEISAIQPELWDRQTLVFLCQSKQMYEQIRESIRRGYKPSSTSMGNGYEIDIYTNLNYSKSERDPAMRNIRAIYCNENMIPPRVLNERFPNSYIIRVREVKRKEPVYDITRRNFGEILEIPRNGGCS